MQVYQLISLWGKTYAIIIAESGNNHNGSYEACCELIDSSMEAGVDAVKFQHRNIDSLYQSGALRAGAEYIKNLSTRFR